MQITVLTMATESQDIYSASATVESFQLNYLWSASSSTGNVSRHTCPICEDIIRETKGRSKGQDAVFCDGSCQMWLRHCCAGLSREHFEALASSEELFLCPVSQHDSQHETITLLKEKVAALRADLLLLKESIVALQASKPKSKESNLTWNVVAGRGIKRPPPPPLQLNESVVALQASKPKSKESNLTWNVVAGRGIKRPPPPPPQQANGSCHGSKDTSKTNAAQQKQPSSQSQQKRVAIPGARRIWGTMRSTHTAVTNALKQLTTVDVSQLIVKRKFKTPDNDQTHVHKWWFIVRGATTGGGGMECSCCTNCMEARAYLHV